MYRKYHTAHMQRSGHGWQRLFNKYPSAKSEGPQKSPLMCPDKKVFSGGCQEAEVSKESGLFPSSWLSESEEEAGAGASAFVGPFMFRSVGKPTVLKPYISTAGNLEKKKKTL